MQTSTTSDFQTAAADAVKALSLARRIVERSTPADYDDGADPVVLIGALALIIALRLPAHAIQGEPSDGSRTDESR